MLSEQTLLILNVSLNIYSFLIGVLILFYLCLTKTNSLKYNKWFMCTLITDIVMIFSDTLTWIFSGPSNPINYIFLPVSMYIYYTTTYLILLSYIFFVSLFLNQHIISKITFIITVSCTVIYYAILYTTPLTGAFFTFDENNIYSRGKFFFIPLIIEFIFYIIVTVNFIKNRKNITKTLLFTLSTFVVFPLFMQIIQLKSYGISLINTGYAFAFIVIFINTNLNLEKEITHKSEEIHQKEVKLIKIKEHTIESLSNLVENRDTDTGEHVRRTRDYVGLLANKLKADGFFTDILTDKYISLLVKAAPLHDIGKIIVPDSILKKKNRLTNEEFDEMKKHAKEGGRIVDEVLDDFDDPIYRRISNEIASYHHEKYDGSGYPEGLKGEQIPLSARIMSIADVFDALVSPRIYKQPMSYDEAFKIIQNEAGYHFDPIISSEFLKLKKELIQINETYSKIKK